MCQGFEWVIDSEYVTESVQLKKDKGLGWSGVSGAVSRYLVHVNVQTAVHFTQLKSSVD